ncbi:MAG: hypothetical protein ACRD3P_09120 [Terriglobales bacterium]
MSAVAIPQPTSSAQKTSWSAKFFEIWWFRIPHGLRRYSTVLSLAWSDGTYLTAWPRLATVLPIAVFALGLLEGVTHFTFLWIARGPEFSTQISWIFDRTVRDYAGPVVFAQMLPLAVLAVALGSIAANLGLALVIGYSLGDILLLGSPFPSEQPFTTMLLIEHRLPLLVCAILFFFLAVWPITATKALVASASRRLRESFISNAIAMAVVQALFVYEWTYFAPMVFRVAWLWPGGTSPIAVGDFHSATASWLMGASVLGILVRTFLVKSSEGRVPGLANGDIEFDRPTSILPPWSRTVFGAGLIILLISGFLASVDEGILLFIGICVVLLARTYVLPYVPGWQWWSDHVERYPALLRLAGATVATFCIARTILALPGQDVLHNSLPGQFGPEVMGLLIGLLVTIILLPHGLFATGDASIRSDLPPITWPALSAVNRTALGAFLVLVAARHVLAYDTCVDSSCCCQRDDWLCALAVAAGLPSLASGLGSGDGTGDDGGPQNGDPQQQNPCSGS